MHGDRSLNAVAGSPALAPVKSGSPAVKTLIVGTLLQGLALAPVHFITALRTGAALPVLAALAAALTGVLFARATRQRPLARQVWGGALTGLATGLVGGVTSALLGDLAAELVPVAAGTAMVAGVCGALIGRLVTPRPTAAG